MPLSREEEYALLRRLEALESVREEMEELGVRTIDDVSQAIVELHQRLDRETEGE